MVKVIKHKVGSYNLPVMIINLKTKTIISVPTQIGCMIDCAFCISKDSDFIRSLKKDEMISLYRKGKEYSKNDNIMLSFTGEGEPFLNLKEINLVIKELESEDAIENFRICTSGVKPKLIKKICKSEKPINIQFSMHSPFDDKRKTIISKSKPLNEILESLRESESLYDEISINYVLMPDFNDSFEDIDEIIKLLDKRFTIKLNPLIRDDGKKEESKNKDVFQKILSMRGFKVFSFEKIGADISNNFYDQLTYQKSNPIILQ